MTSALTATVTCAGCRRVYPWRPHYAGRLVRCRCGHVNDLFSPQPPRFASDTFDLAAPVDRTPRRSIYQPTIPYRTQIAPPDWRWHYVKHVHLPAAIVALGAAGMMTLHALNGFNNHALLFWTAHASMTVALMLLVCLAVAYLFRAAFGEVIFAAPKLLAMYLLAQGAALLLPDPTVPFSDIIVAYMVFAAITAVYILMTLVLFDDLDDEPAAVAAFGFVFANIMAYEPAWLIVS